MFQMLGVGIWHFSFHFIYAFVEHFSSFPRPPCVVKVQATSRAIADASWAVLISLAFHLSQAW